MESKATYGRLPAAEIIIDDGHNPRTAFDEQALMDLGGSFESDGQLMPILVNQTADEEYHLIAGERRLRAVRAAGTKTIECRIFQNLSDRDAARYTAIENIQRANLNHIEEARMMDRLERAGESLEAIARLFNYAKDTCRRKMNLLKLPEAVQHMVVRDKDKFPLPIHQAQLLVGLDEKDAIKLARQIAPSCGPVSGEDQVRSMIDELKNGPAFPGVDPKEKRTAATGGRVLSNVRHDPDNDGADGFAEITDDGWPAIDDEAPVRQVDEKGRLVDPTVYKVPVPKSVMVAAEVTYGRVKDDGGNDLWYHGIFLRTPASPCEISPCSNKVMPCRTATDAIVLGLAKLQDAVGDHQEAATSKTLKGQLNDVIVKIGQRLQFLRGEEPETVTEPKPAKPDPQQKKNIAIAKKIKAVECAISFHGTMELSRSDGMLYLRDTNALVTVQSGGAKCEFMVETASIDFGGAQNMNKVIDLMKNSQKNQKAAG